MAYSKRGVPMPFDFRNGKRDTGGEKGWQRQQPQRQSTTFASPRGPMVHRGNLDPTSFKNIIAEATKEVVDQVTRSLILPKSGRMGYYPRQSRGLLPNTRHMELPQRMPQQTQGGPQGAQSWDRPRKYNETQPRHYIPRSNSVGTDTPAQAPPRPQQEARWGNKVARRGTSQGKREPHLPTATPASPEKWEGGPWSPPAGARGRLHRLHNPYAMVMELHELEQQATQDKYQSYGEAINAIQKWWIALYQSGAQNFHCPLCSFNRPGEQAVFQHCRQAHPTHDKCYPYRLYINGHVTDVAEKSCSLNAVLAILSYYEEESHFTQEVRNTYTAPCRENTERIIRAMGVNMPLAPVSALEQLIKNDPMLRRMFSTTIVAGVHCEACGWALPMEEAYPSYLETLQKEPAIITLQPGKRAPIQLTQKLLMQQYRSTWVTEEHVCTGEKRERLHAPWHMTATKSHKYEDAVALEFGHWDKQVMGVEEVPFVILLPHHNGTAEYGLVGLVATNAPNHVVAYIPSTLQKDTTWVMIDGMVQKVQRKPLNTHKVILCLYRRLMPEMVPEEDEVENEQGMHGRKGEWEGRKQRVGRTQDSSHHHTLHHTGGRTSRLQLDG
ncbi:putative SLACS retrotransposable element [Trypanosoma cruzi]|nr:putative SLACS retrotransposable element [Trypanosoma cruzi]